MLQWILTKLSGDYNQKQIDKILPLVREVNDMCESFNDFTDEQIAHHTTILKEKYAEGKSLDELLPEAYGLVKQACKRLVGRKVAIKGEQLEWNMVPYDVQIIGGIVLHRKMIAEMKTGEGKTLVAAFPAYLNALTGEGVHVVTVNDYLASRDAEWIGHLYTFLGLTVGSVTKSTQPHLRRKEYEKDITYVENSELGFDYLRDNLAKSLEGRQLVRRPLAFAIVDEIDSILIDEARTPLIISEPHAEATDKYGHYAKIVQSLTPCSSKKKVSKGLLHELVNDEKKSEEDGDYYLDEKNKTALLSGQGIEKLEKLLRVENLYKDIGYEEIHHIENALKARACYEIDKDYIVRDGEVLIVDQHTGRALPGRRFSEGLHQAIEAKEGVAVQRESRTLATITYQNFFKQYKKLAGMTGTATTEGEEFHKIYDLEVLAIPTHHELIRVDANDKVFFNQQTKRKAVQEYITFAHEMGQPILIGTSSIYTSEHVSSILTKKNIIHSVLNAKHHEKEAHIVSHAGEYKSVIVATNMAGRGTDIKLQSGLHEKLADNYASWMKTQTTNKDNAGKGVSVVIYSAREFEYTMEGLKRIWGVTDENIRNAQQGRSSFDTIERKIQFFTKKKYPTDPFVQIMTRPVEQHEPTIVQKEFHYGLFILGTEKHDSRRIDNQLRGRAGRQGDPGHSVFFVALDDLIMRQMGGEKIQSIASFMFSKKDLEELELSQKQFTSSIVRAQKNMEAWHFSIRKHLFDYDSVIDQQRQRVYSKRDDILFSGETPEGQESFVHQTMEEITSYIHDIVGQQARDARDLQQPIPDFLDTISQELGVEIPTSTREELIQVTYTHIIEPLQSFFVDHVQKTLGTVSVAGRYQICTQVFLQTLDTLWIEHIDEMQYLRDKVGLMGYAQLDPLVVYKKEAFEKFQQLMYRFKRETVASLMRLQFVAQQPVRMSSASDQGSSAGFMDTLQSVANSPEVVAKAQQAHHISKQPKIYQKDSEFEVFESVPQSTSPVVIDTAPKKLRPNDKVSIQYPDGRIVRDVKYKKVQEEVEKGLCTLV